MLQTWGDLTHDTEAHKYWLAGDPIPSVTTVLNWDKPIPDGVKTSGKFVMACEFGTLVHGVTEDDDLGRERSPEYMGGAYAAADLWQKWLADRKAKVLEVEIGVCSWEWWYAGKVDRLVEIDGKIYVVDIKSGGLYTKGRYQVAGYVEACREMGYTIEGGYLVGLKGGYGKTGWQQSLIKQKHHDIWFDTIKRYNEEAYA